MNWQSTCSKDMLPCELDNGLSSEALRLLIQSGPGLIRSGRCDEIRWRVSEDSMSEHIAARSLTVFPIGLQPIKRLPLALLLGYGAASAVVTVAAAEIAGFVAKVPEEEVLPYERIVGQAFEMCADLR